MIDLPNICNHSATAMQTSATAVHSKQRKSKRCSSERCNPSRDAIQSHAIQAIAIQAMQYASVNSPPCNANEGNCSTFKATQFEAVQFQAMQPQARCSPKHCNPSDAIHIRCNPNAKQPKTLQSQSNAIQSIANPKQCKCNQSNAMQTSATATCQSNVPSKMQPQDNAGRSLPITSPGAMLPLHYQARAAGDDHKLWQKGGGRTLCTPCHCGERTSRSLLHGMEVHPWPLSRALLVAEYGCNEQGGISAVSTLSA